MGWGRKARWCLVSAVVATSVLAPLGGPGANAAFPGANGKLVFQRDGQIYSMLPDGSSLTQLTSDPNVGSNFPNWSPDGTRIVYQRGAQGDIMVMNADGSDAVNLTNSAAFDGYPVWSPDGTKIAFTSDRDGGQGDIYVMDADGANVVRITTTRGFYPSWSPDGAWIAYTVFGDDLYKVPASGGTPVAVTDTPTDEYLPDWSPDGSRIVFQRSTGFGHDIFVIDADGTDETNLTNDATFDGHPAWSPDGTTIAFVRESPGFNLWTMATDGSGKTQITDTSLSDEMVPDWQPVPPTPPSTTLEITADTVLTEDHHGPVVFAADDVTLDCAGWSIVGSGEPFGVLVEDRDGVTLQNCRVTGFSQYGIHFVGSVGSSILDNEATRNGMEDIYGSGFTLTEVHDSVIEGNLAFDNAEPGGAGFEINSASGDRFVSNRSIANENSSGFYTSDIHDNVFVGNTASQNGHGFNMDEPSGSNNTFRNNVASDNAGAGFRSTGVSGNAFLANDVHGNGEFGFLLLNSHRNRLRGNDASHNGIDGLYLGGSRRNRILRNAAVGNGAETGGHGIFLEFASTYNVLRYNEVLESGSTGIPVTEGSNGNTFEGNTSSRNGAIGFHVIASSNTFLENRAMENGEHGFRVSDGRWNKLRRNVACGNGILDALEDPGVSGNAWAANEFCTSDI